ncbi:MAG: alpha/beta fold hydrolase, partial [Myxococcota bacterium]|nr:alpha/beta fold hydrolase [Myxococcota bacterium]
VAVAGEVATRIPGHDGGPSLEACVYTQPDAVRAVVLCHPHPLYGGSMHSPVPLVIAKALSGALQQSVAWVRFNFRGVGTSEGSYDDGRGEVDDARAAIEYVQAFAPRARVAVCGHSFGSWVGLRAAASKPVVDRALLISPSTRFFAFRGDALQFAGQTTIFIGSEDEYSGVDEARALAVELGADIRVFDGFDHHFTKSRRALAEAALPVVASEAMNP